MNWQGGARLTVDDVRPLATLNAQQAASVLGCSDDAVYDAIKRGEIPSLRLGRKILVPVAPLLAMLGQEAA
jgi:excisionase family DNA binding protein